MVPVSRDFPLVYTDDGRRDLDVEGAEPTWAWVVGREAETKSNT
jgi:hypothetical protein